MSIWGGEVKGKRTEQKGIERSFNGIRDVHLGALCLDWMFVVGLPITSPKHNPGNFYLGQFGFCPVKERP